MRGTSRSTCGWLWATFAACGISLLTSLSAVYADAPLPALLSRVVDQTGSLSQEQSQTLERSLEEFERKKGAQIVVVIVATTSPEAIEQYSIRLAEQWRIGRKGVDDGAILLVAKDDRKLRIEVGYGLEGALSDLTSKRIIEDIIVPYFKSGNIYGGIQAGVQAMMQVVEGEPLPAPTVSPPEDGDGRLFGAAVGFIIFTLILRSIIGKGFGATLGAGFGLLGGSLILGFFSGLIIFILCLIFGFGSAQTSSGRRGFGGSSSGRGSSSGGGFSGGGGSFGGGGASGSW